MERIESVSATYPRILPSSRVAIVIALTLLTVVSAAAQAPATDQHPYGLDPYKPSDAALLRDYGGTLVAQTPLLDLRNLDPYKPSHAALLREIGGALPLWGIAWYPGPMPASLTPFPTEDRYRHERPPGDIGRATISGTRSMWRLPRLSHLRQRHPSPLSKGRRTTMACGLPSRIRNGLAPATLSRSRSQNLPVLASMPVSRSSDGPAQPKA